MVCLFIISSGLKISWLAHPLPGGRQENTQIASQTFLVTYRKSKQYPDSWFQIFIIVTINRKPFLYGTLESFQHICDLILFFNFIDNPRNNVLYCNTLKNTFSSNFYDHFLFFKILRCKIYPFCV